MIRYIFITGLVLGSLISSFSQSAFIEKEDIASLMGNWSGSLTYLDYTSGKPFSMPCDLTITSIKENKKLSLQYSYPNEPRANSKEKIRISKDRSKIDGKEIVSRTENEVGSIELITEFQGKDGNENKQAVIRNIYRIGKSNLIFQKKVRFENEEKWILRNIYEFERM